MGQALLIIVIFLQIIKLSLQQEQVIGISLPEIVISISRSGLLKSCARFIIEQSEIIKKEAT